MQPNSSKASGGITGGGGMLTPVHRRCNAAPATEYAQHTEDGDVRSEQFDVPQSRASRSATATAVVFMVYVHVSGYGRRRIASGWDG